MSCLQALGLNKERQRVIGRQAKWKQASREVGSFFPEGTVRRNDRKAHGLVLKKEQLGVGRSHRPVKYSHQRPFSGIETLESAPG